MEGLEHQAIKQRTR